MKALLSLALHSLVARRFTVVLTITTVALSVMLLLGVERLRHEARASFLRGISGTDLIVGARAHPVQLLLYSVFRIGDASNNLSWESARWVSSQPEVAWAVPISLGDSHRGFRVIGTTQGYFEQVGARAAGASGFAAGAPFAELFDAVIGAEVARSLSYQLGDRIVLAHGTAAVAAQAHDDRPFRIVGILSATGTATDQGVYISLPAMEAIHLNWRSGTRIGSAPRIEDLPSERLVPRSVTAVFVGLKTRMASFALQRAVNGHEDEPLSAILPGVALQQFWSLLGTVERALAAAAACVVAAGFMVLLTTILATLNERRREMAILRAVGAGARHVFALLLLEAALLAAAASVLGMVLVELGLAWLGPWLQSRHGIFIEASLLEAQAWQLPALVALVGAGIGLLPALLAYRRSVQDGLTLRH